jgi:hypothetical protein
MTFREAFRASRLTPLAEGLNGPHRGFVVALSNTCSNCGEFAHLHAEGDKCMFAPTTFTHNAPAVARYKAHWVKRRTGHSDVDFWDSPIT